MNPEWIHHKAISASAGSGKTFQLAHRYIELMARGVNPDRIISLTFSRKAAGEIFDSVVRYLCQAASNAEVARRTGVLIGQTELAERDFLRLLRVLLDNLHRLHIGTLDSFTVGVAQSFPMELGIPPRFHLVADDGAAGNTRQEVLARIFTPGGNAAEVRREFLQAYKLATFGREEKALEERLDAMIAGYRGYYQVLPEAGGWGCEEVIWPEGSPWLKDAGDVEAAVLELERLLSQEGLVERVMDRWHKFLNAARNHGVASAWSEDLEYLFARLSPHIEDLRRGSATVKLDRTSCHLSLEQSRVALVLLAHIMNTELTVALQRTRGVYRVLQLYEGFYDTMLRRHGKLTFSDVQYLLTSANPYSGGSVISRLPSTESRLYIDYRLDCKMDHWLLDEFQDTSDLQWEVLRNLADEILQDNSGERSFFYVGDTKQAIYGWRGGNARLFDQILDYYREAIYLSHLSTSFRSCQAVIDTVNRIFGDIPAGFLPEEAVAQWRRSWQEHRCEQGAVPEHGYSAILEPLSDEGNLKPTDEDRYRLVAALLKEIDPLSKGLSVAVLMRTNNSGRNMVDYLRRECSGLRIVHEGRAFIQDNPVVAVLLSLVKFAAHPGDTFAWRHLQMSPLRQHFAVERLNRSNLPLILMRQIQTGGFQSLIRYWGAQLDAVHPLDDFGCKRLDELIAAAIEFDQDDSRDVNAFLRFVELYEIHDLATDDSVRVMTIHQSKGLGFDIVIVPDLQSGNMAEGGQANFALARDPLTGRPSWALEMPRRIIAENDAVLKEQLAVANQTAAFDALCLVYVALTRARQGLYMITSFPGKSAKLLTPAAFLKQRLTGNAKAVTGKEVTVGGEDFLCLYETGDSNWHHRARERRRPVSGVPPVELTSAFSQYVSRRQRLVHVQPSKRSEIEQKAGALFAPEARDGRDIGAAIHELLYRVSWLEETDLEAIIEEWGGKTEIRDGLKQKAIERFRWVVTRPDVRRILTRPSGGVTLWREKRFEVVLGDRWLSGAFDRVAILRDGEGRTPKATIYDFKSDVVSAVSDMATLAERYRPQMVLYRSALARMLSLSPGRISLKLLFTHAGKVHDLLPDGPAGEQLSLWTTDPSA